jgi:hypothetical protein
MNTSNHETSTRCHWLKNVWAESLDTSIKLDRVHYPEKLINLGIANKIVSLGLGAKLLHPS